MELRAGDRIDRYTLIRPLGKGGQGSVWQVVDPLDEGSLRALKLVQLADTGQASFVRARREAKILAHLTHPSLCACHGLFEDLDRGLVGVVLDLVHGRPLDDVMRETQICVWRDCIRAVFRWASDGPWAFGVLPSHGAAISRIALGSASMAAATRFWGMGCGGECVSGAAPGYRESLCGQADAISFASEFTRALLIRTSTRQWLKSVASLLSRCEVSGGLN